MTLETDEGAQRYQGIVPIEGERLADSLQAYFREFRAIADAAVAACGRAGRVGHAAAEASRRRLAAGGQDAAAIEDAWRRVQLIADTLTPEELRTLADAEILHRLFNEDDVRLFEPSPVYFRCRCSRERVAGMLQGLGEVETRCGAGRTRQGRSALRFLQSRLRIRRGGCRAVVQGRRLAADSGSCGSLIRTASADRRSAVLAAAALALALALALATGVAAAAPTPARSMRNSFEPMPARCGADRARPRIVLRSRPVGFRQDLLRDLSRSAARFRAAE